MNTQHTPGPWNSMSDSRIFAAEHGDVENLPIVGEAYVCNGVIGSDACRANARLMAAAPEMLEMLRMLYGIEMDASISNKIAAVISKAEAA